MKTWFIFKIHGNAIGTWANSVEEAEINLRKKYGNIEMEYLGNSCHNPRIPIDEITKIGMSISDTLIAYGYANLFAELR